MISVHELMRPQPRSELLLQPQEDVKDGMEVVGVECFVSITGFLNRHISAFAQFWESWKRSWCPTHGDGERNEDGHLHSCLDVNPATSSETTRWN